MIRLGWCIALSLVLFSIGCHDEEALAQTERCGNVIVEAIEAFREATGDYPGALSELTPGYLAEIPQPEWGLKKWNYEAWEDGFTLGVDESSRTGDGNSHYFRYMSGQGWMWGD
jgi:hypothetical protein